MIIKQIVRDSTEAKLDEILTDEYIEEKIRQRSEKTISNLLDDQKRRLEEGFTFENWQERALAASFEQDYKNAIIYYKKCIKGLRVFPHRMRKAYIGSIHLSLAEVQILNFDYEDALATINENSQFADSASDKLITHFLECITKRLLDTDNSETEQKLNEILKSETIIIDWEFYLMENWLRDAHVTEENRSYIIQKIELIKKNTTPAFPDE